MIRQLMATGLCIATAFSAGCSEKSTLGTVKGTALVKGKSFSDASVMVVNPESGFGASGDLDSNGTFAILDPLPMGTYKVYFAPKASDMNNSAAPTPFKPNKSIPTKYWSASSTDLQVQIKKGENEYPIVIN